MDSREHLLVVDDDEILRDALRDVLEHAGYRVSMASGGREALSMVATDKPDVILLDLLMPDLNGSEVCSRLKKDSQTRDVPVIILTGVHDNETRDLTIACGADEFLNKPVSTMELMARVSSVLKTRHLLELVSGNHPENEKALAVALSTAEEAPATILIVEDDTVFAESIEEVMADMGMVVSKAASLADARLVLSGDPMDLVLLDLIMPDGDGLDLLREIRADVRLSGLSVVVLTARTEVQRKVLGLEMGADDYLVKPVSFIELRARVQNQIHHKRVRDAMLARLTLLAAETRADPLTGLYNRGHLDEALSKLVDTAGRHRQDLAVLMIDIDRFKSVNDAHGHAVGDGVLRAIATVLKQQLRAMDWVARYGGEEFGVVLPMTDRQTAALVAERMRSQVEQAAITVAGLATPLSVTVSVGVTSKGGRPVSGPQLLSEADKALYLAKNLGRNQTRAFE